MDPTKPIFEPCNAKMCPLAVAVEAKLVSTSFPGWSVVADNYALTATYRRGSEFKCSTSWELPNWARSLVFAVDRRCGSRLTVIDVMSIMATITDD